MLPLTSQETKRLARLEAAIAKGIGTFKKVGMSLAQIRDQRLYRVDYERFEDYCLAKWDLTARHVNHLIAKEKVVNSLGTIGSRLNERQARELARLGPEDAKEIISIAGAEAAAKTLRELVAKRQEEIERDEADALRSRPTLSLKPRDRLQAIRKLYSKILRELDGSIDSVLADWIEANVKEALEKIEGYYLPAAA